AGCIGRLRVEETIGRIDPLAIHCESPQHAAATASLADLLFPDRFALLIRIEGPNHSGFVSRDEHRPSAARCGEDGRDREVDVWGIRIGTGRCLALGAPAAAVPNVVLRLLTTPFDLSGCH